MQNIEQFDQFFAEYLTSLYGAFPLPIKFDTLPPALQDLEWLTFLKVDSSSPEWHAFLEKRSAAIEKRDNLAQESKLRTATVSWLFETGYFSAERNQQNRDFAIGYVDESGISEGCSHGCIVLVEKYANARLTPKGLEVLHSVPKSLSDEKEERKSFGEQLSDQVKDVAMEGRKQVISKIVGEIIGNAMKVLTTP